MKFSAPAIASLLALSLMSCTSAEKAERSVASNSKVEQCIDFLQKARQGTPQSESACRTAVQKGYVGSMLKCMISPYTSSYEISSRYTTCSLEGTDPYLMPKPYVNEIPAFDFSVASCSAKFSSNIYAHIRSNELQAVLISTLKEKGFVYTKSPRSDDSEAMTEFTVSMPNMFCDHHGEAYNNKTCTHPQLDLYLNDADGKTQSHLTDKIWAGRSTAEVAAKLKTILRKKWPTCRDLQSR